MVLIENAVKIGDQQYDQVNSITVHSDGNKLSVNVTDNSARDTTLTFERVKGFSDEQVVREAINAESFTFDEPRQILIEEPIIGTYDLYEYQAN